jgi:hypothetical protein
MNYGRRRLGIELLEFRRLLTTVSVEIPMDLEGNAGGQVLTPVIIDEAIGVRAAEIQIEFDPEILSASSASVVPGSAWADAEDVQLVANVSEETGTIVIFVFGPEDLDASAGSLVDIAFTIRPEVPVGTTTVVDLVEVQLNEGQIEVDPAPLPGPDPTDGMITVVVADVSAGIAGHVYADTNGNHLVDPLEGIPGARLTLIHSATGDQWHAVTSDDGSYEFADLPHGQFAIVLQPLPAYIEGGPGEISIDLAVGEQLSEQNFRQLGLRPEFVYVRLFTTLAMPIGSESWSETLRSIQHDADEQASSTAQVQEQTTMDVQEAILEPGAEPAVTNAAMVDVSDVLPDVHMEGELAEGEGGSVLPLGTNWLAVPGEWEPIDVHVEAPLPIEAYHVGLQPRDDNNLSTSKATVRKPHGPSDGPHQLDSHSADVVPVSREFSDIGATTDEALRLLLESDEMAPLETVIPPRDSSLATTCAASG